ncbi:MAG: hypothetical protein NTV05_03610 [Acidobacteria bacterium]|nr:hypothetical protein [Acidobacteriota bacterium]
MRTKWMLAATMVAGMSLTGSAAVAQQSDADWLAQCKEQQGGQFRHCEVRPVNLPGGGSLHVDAQPNGGVQLTGWDQATVAGSARIQIQADSEVTARDIAGQIVVGTSSGALRADGPASKSGRSWSVSFVLSAPRHSDVEIKALNGPVGITGISGQIEATTTNGPMSLTELGGNVRARTTNGPLSIVLAGTSWDGEGLDAQTQNGPVSVAVPDGYSAQLEARTVNGPFRVDIPVTIQGELPNSRTRSIKTPIGSGGAPVRVATTNGPMSIKKR